MSMDRCNWCDRTIDTDYDMDCYRDKTDPLKRWEDYRTDNTVMCEGCRDGYEKQTGREMEW